MRLPAFTLLVGFAVLLTSCASFPVQGGGSGGGGGVCEKTTVNFRELLPLEDIAYLRIADFVLEVNP